MCLKHWTCLQSENNVYGDSCWCFICTCCLHHLTHLQEKIQHPKKEGEEATRAQLYDNDVRWGPKKLKPRASEYNLMYKRINKHALELTKKWERPVSVPEAAEELAVKEKKVTQPLKNGGISMYAFMMECRQWLKAQKENAADAVDGGAMEGEDAAAEGDEVQQ
jgi:hypothetical protein